MELMEKIKTAPQDPGCYLFKDENGTVIYVGKAKILRSRVRQYFLKSAQKDDKGFLMAKKIRDVEFIITDTERDALIREYQLIKHYRPWFNIQHKADRNKTWYIKLNRTGRYTSFEVTDRQSGSLQDYLGYFKSAGRAREAIVTLNRVFQTPVCSQHFTGDQNPGCIHSSLNQCLGPCQNKISQEEYEAVIKEILAFFKGKQAGVYRRLKKEMQEHAAAMAFEKAADVKERLEAITYLGSQYRHYISIPANRDVIAFLRAFREKGFSLFYIHNGEVTGRCDFEEKIEEERLRQFLTDNIQSADASGCPEMTNCLRYISADKLFVILPIKQEPNKIYDLLLKKHREFQGP